MPDTNDGPAGAASDTVVPTPTKESPLPGFAASMTMGLPSESEPGESKVETAVDESAKVEAPQAKSDTPAKEPAKAEVKTDAAPKVNFDGLSDQSKAYWENALKAGHATPEDVDRARKESLFQSAWSKRNAAKDKEVEAVKAKYAKMDEDIALLNRIRADEKALARWEKMSQPDPDETGEELADKRTAKQIAIDTYNEREAEKAARDAREQGDSESRKSGLIEVAKDQMTALGVDGATMERYCKEEQDAAGGPDDLLAMPPSLFARNLVARHEKATLAAENAALKEQLNLKVSKQVQSSKQSLPPVGRVADVAPRTGLRKILADAGVERLTDVPGFGFANGHVSE